MINSKERGLYHDFLTKRYGRIRYKYGKWEWDIWAGGLLPWARTFFDKYGIKYGMDV